MGAAPVMSPASELDWLDKAIHRQKVEVAGYASCIAAQELSPTSLWGLSMIDEEVEAVAAELAKAGGIRWHSGQERGP
jgi:hypothetical protein